MKRIIAALVALSACAYLYATEPSAEGQTSDVSEAPCPDTMQDGYDLDPCPTPPTTITPAGNYPLPVCVPCAQPSVGDPTEPVPFDDGDPAYPLDELVPETPVAGPISGDPSFTG